MINLGDEKLTVISEIGRGAYGVVYKCCTREGEMVAVKAIPIQEQRGLPCLMECSLMTSVISPGLASATTISSDQQYLYIVSELGSSDLGRWVRANYRPNTDQLIRWTFQLLCGLSCLQSQGLVHADVKPSNIILYSNDDVKLTDYNIATFRDVTIIRSYYTYPYRPYEIWQSLQEDKTRNQLDIRSDIWALGCTLYEATTGHALFPSQKAVEENTGIKNGIINALLDWAIQEEHIDLRHLKTPKININYRKMKGLPAEIESLIRTMLRFRIEDRPYPQDLLSSSCFGIFSPQPYQRIYPSIAKIKLEEWTRAYTIMSSEAEKSGSNKNIVLTQAMHIYSRTGQIRGPSQTKIICCLFMAAKMITPAENNYPADDQIITMEREICYHLGFRLHCDL